MKAVIYARVSTAEQAENLSLETQQQACKDYCRREGIEVDGAFVEAGESAKTADRPELQRLLKYCQKHRKQIRFVAVYDVSRFSRNTLDHLFLRAWLKNLGISLRAATQQFDDSSTGELVEFLLSGLAHFDNRQRADRTVDGMKAALAKGRWTHQPPLGYRKLVGVKGGPSLVPDEARAPLVQLAFERMATGRYSKSEVLTELTALGLRTRRGERLSNQSFGSLLRNPIYVGRVRVRRFDFEGPGDFEPLVTEGVFQAVQAVLDGRKPSARQHHRLPAAPVRPLRSLRYAAHWQLVGKRRVNPMFPGRPRSAMVAAVETWEGDLWDRRDRRATGIVFG